MNDLPRIHLGTALRTGDDAHAAGELTELHYGPGGRQTLSLAGPAPFSIDVNALGGDELYLQGHFSPTLNLECARCLRPVTVPLSIKLGTLLRYVPSAEQPYL